MTHTTTWLALIAWVLLCSVPRWAQGAEPASERSPNEVSRDDPEEVIVHGQRLSDLRSAIEVARVRVYDIFNEVNTDDEFDVRCEREASTGTRIQRHICRPRFEGDISNSAAKTWTDTLKWVCTGGVSQDCIFSPLASQAISAAQGEESKEAYMQQRFAEQMARAVSQSPELRQAMLDYQALERAYREARSGRNTRGCARPEQRARCLR
jgi:hypothetical protein